MPIGDADYPRARGANYTALKNLVEVKFRYQVDHELQFHKDLLLIKAEVQNIVGYPNVGLTELREQVSICFYKAVSKL